MNRALQMSHITTYRKSEGKRKPRRSLDVSLLEKTELGVWGGQAAPSLKAWEHSTERTPEDRQRAPRVSSWELSPHVWGWGNKHPKAAEAIPTGHLELGTVPVPTGRSLLTHKVSMEYPEGHCFTGRKELVLDQPLRSHLMKLTSNLKRIKINPIHVKS